MYSRKNLTLFSSVFTLWLFIHTFVCGHCALALPCFILTIIGVLYARFPQLPESKLSERMLNLFEVDAKNLKKNFIFHKAGGNHAPQNTIEAVEQAIANGVTSIEIDVEFTKDDIGVVIHGPRVDDTTDGSGFVADYTLPEIQLLNASAKDPNKDRYPVVRVPTLEACVDLCVRNNLVVFLDCKSNAAQTARLISKLYKQHPMLYQTGIVCSFYPNIIYAVRRADPNIVTALTHRRDYISKLEDDKERHKELWKRVITPFADMLLEWGHRYFFWFLCGNSFFLSGKGNLCLDEKKFWAGLGIRMVAWTVNDPQERNYLLHNLGIPTITDGL